MTTKNDITGDLLKSKVPTDLYRDNYDKIFRKKDKSSSEDKQKSHNEQISTPDNN